MLSIFCNFYISPFYTIYLFFVFFIYTFDAIFILVGITPKHVDGYSHFKAALELTRCKRFWDETFYNA